MTLFTAQASETGLIKIRNTWGSNFTQVWKFQKRQRDEETMDDGD